MIISDYINCSYQNNYRNRILYKIKIISKQKKQREMYVTRKILNEQQKRINLPHSKQIMSEIKSSKQNQQYLINKHQSIHSLNRNGISSVKRAKTAKERKQQRCIHTQSRQGRSSSFYKKINYKFSELDTISSRFDKLFEPKSKKTQKFKMKFPKKFSGMKRIIQQKQNNQIANCRRIKRNIHRKSTFNESNIFLGYSKQKINNVIPLKNVKDQNVKIVQRCIKGGYFDQVDDFCDTVSKNQVLKMKKQFITFETVYNCITGNKGKGISDIRPQTVNKNTMRNIVYFLQNEKTFKANDKTEMKRKMKFIE